VGEELEKAAFRLLRGNSIAWEALTGGTETPKKRRKLGRKHFYSMKGQSQSSEEGANEGVQRKGGRVTKEKKESQIIEMEKGSR